MEMGKKTLTHNVYSKKTKPRDKDSITRQERDHKLNFYFQHNLFFGLLSLTLSFIIHKYPTKEAQNSFCRHRDRRYHISTYTLRSLP